MSAASIAAEVEGGGWGWGGGKPVSAQTIRRTLHQMVFMAVIPEGSLF